MKKVLLFALFVPTLFLSSERLAGTQKTPEKSHPEQESRPKAIALKSGEPAALAYDVGMVRFLVSSEDTGGAWSLVELTEMPG